MWVPSKQATKILGISPGTLRRWDSKGLIPTQRTPSNYRLYDISSFQTKTQVQLKEEQEVKQDYIYARVSSRKQKEDLERQISLLQEKYPKHMLISDIGSGINFQRPGLQKLLQLSSKGLVGEIVCSHRDRLCRLAFDLLEYIFKLHETRLLVHHQDENISNATELAEDILAINTVFICRMQGRRSAQHRKEREHLLEYDGKEFENE